jgi:hypothetical protein
MERAARQHSGSAKEESGVLGLEWKDTIGLLLVPVAVGLLGVFFPWAQERRKRVNYEALARRELAEATPRNAGDNESQENWHKLLTKRFVHEVIISAPADSCDFILSLNPGIAYYLSQAWMNFHKAEETRSLNESKPYAEEWCYFLYKTCLALDGAQCRQLFYPRGAKKEHLVHTVWLRWHQELGKLYPSAHGCGAEQDAVGAKLVAQRSAAA